ncbi:hypothetical protein JOF44_002448 [Brachybacterium fresconis]|uniref:Uncharacterized protein n=1 Tax=Brachybacterium fresconis TaxID=173363 RepID=A0ABS4YLR7_9MICO|nr:hypothetical protein [Brachybacterium fresconis]
MTDGLPEPLVSAENTPSGPQGGRFREDVVKGVATRDPGTA